MSKSILIITPRIPYPLKDGGALAMYQCIEMYKKKGYDVHLLSINTHKHWLSEQDYPTLFNRLSSFETVTVNTDVRVRSAFINLFTTKSYNVQRFVNKEFEDAIKSRLLKTEFDFIQCESIFVAPYLDIIKEFSDAKTICRVHNIEHLIWERITQNEGGLFKRKYLQLLTDRLKKFELEILNKFDLLLNISKVEEKEMKTLGITTAQYHLPYGIEKPRFQAHQISVEQKSVYHIGSMDWLPNQEGVTWFVQEVWKTVLAKQPEVKLYLAGKNMPNFMYRFQSKSIEIIGEVDDMTTFSLEKNILIIPLRSGAGMRIKVLEAMMLGKTIISTALGIDSFALENKKHFLRAETAAEFATQIDWCLQHPTEARALGERAKEYALTHYDKRIIYKELNDFLTELISYDD